MNFWIMYIPNFLRRHAIISCLVIVDTFYVLLPKYVFRKTRDWWKIMIIHRKNDFWYTSEICAFLFFLSEINYNTLSITLTHLTLSKTLYNPNKLQIVIFCIKKVTFSLFAVLVCPCILPVDKLWIVCWNFLTIKWQK